MIIGASAGGVVAVRRILSKMPESIDFPMLIVLHRMKNVDSRLDSILQTNTSIPVCEVEDKQRIEPNRIYVAPRITMSTLKRMKPFPCLQMNWSILVGLQ